MNHSSARLENSLVTNSTEQRSAWDWIQTSLKWSSLPMESRRIMLQGALCLNWVFSELAPDRLKNHLLLKKVLTGSNLVFSSPAWILVKHVAYERKALHIWTSQCLCQCLLLSLVSTRILFKETSIYMEEIYHNNSLKWKSVYPDVSQESFEKLWPKMWT